MTPEVERFLDLATRELEAQPELREEAKGELMARLGHQMDGVDSIEISEPLRVLEAKGKRGRWKRFVTSAILLLLLLALGFVGVRLIRIYFIFEDSKEFGSVHRFGRAIDLSERPLLQKLREESLDLPVGLDSELYDKASDQSAAVRERFPDDAGALRLHVMNLLMERNYEWKRLPPDIIDEIEKIEVTPFWGELRLYRSIEEARLDSFGRRTSRVQDWELWKEVRAQWQEIVASVEIPDAPNHLYGKQLEALPDVEDFTSMIINGHCREVAFTERGSVLTLFSFVGIELEEFRVRGNRDGLLKLSQEMRKVVCSRFDPFDQWRGSYIFGSENPLLNPLRDELTNEMFEEGNEAFDKELKEWDRIAVAYSSVETAGVPWTDEVMRTVPLSLEYKVEGGPLLGELSEFKPLRVAEYSFGERLAAIGGAVSFSLFVLMVGLDVIRRSKKLRGLARGVMPLLGLRDHVWIGGLGLLVPFVCWVAVRFSSLGMRDLRIAQDEGLPWLLQTIAAMLLCLAMLVAAVRWRWSKRGGFLDLCGGVGVKVGWVAAGLIGLAMAGIGGIRFVDDIDDRRQMFLVAVASFGGFGVLWILWLAFSGVCQSSHRALGSNLVGLTLLLWLAVVALGLLSMEPLLHLEEKYWFAKDVILRPMDGRFGTVFEERATHRLATALKDLK